VSSIKLNDFLIVSNKQGISNISNLFPDITGPIAREVEDEANSYFQVFSSFNIILNFLVIASFRIGIILNIKHKAQSVVTNNNFFVLDLFSAHLQSPAASDTHNRRGSRLAQRVSGSLPFIHLTVKESC
jgi:hypothetical protein